MFSGSAADFVNAHQRSGLDLKLTRVFCHLNSSDKIGERLSNFEISAHRMLLTWSRVGAVHGILQFGCVNKNHRIAQLSSAVLPTPWPERIATQLEFAKKFNASACHKSGSADKISRTNSTGRPRSFSISSLNISPRFFDRRRELSAHVNFHVDFFAERALNLEQQFGDFEPIALFDFDRVLLARIGVTTFSVSSPRTTAVKCSKIS